MEHFELPETLVNTIKSVCDGMNLTWNLYHSDNRISATLIWTKAKPNKNQKNGSHFLGQNDQMRDHPATASDTTSSAGFSISQAETPALDITTMPPHRKPPLLRRHKSPSQYRRDQRRLREFKARKRLEAQSIPKQPEATSHPHEAFKSTKIDLLTGPEPNKQHSHIDNISLEDFDPLNAASKFNNIPVASTSTHVYDPLHIPQGLDLRSLSGCDKSHAVMDSGGGGMANATPPQLL